MKNRNKIVLLCGLLILIGVGAQSPRTIYRGIFMLSSDGDSPVLMHKDAGGGVTFRATTASEDLFVVDMNGVAWASGGVSGSGAALTNLASTNGPWLTVIDARAMTNTAGDLTLEANGTFLQMSASGNNTGFQYYDLYNGGSKLMLRRKADGGGSVLANIFTITNDVWTFGVPVVVTGTFTGDGAGLTNLPVQTYSVNATNWLGVGASNAYTGTFTGDGTGLTNVTAVSTNNEALFATNAPDGKAIASQDWVTNTASAILDGLYISTTNGAASSSLVVNGNAQWGIQFAVRGQAAQTNDILQVQNATTDLIWGVGAQGHLSWANAPTNATATANPVLYLVITNAGVGYAIPLHGLVTE